MDFPKNIQMDPGLLNSLLQGKKTEDIEVKLLKSLEKKEKGNSFFKSGANKEALYHYNCALMYVNGMYGLSESQTKQVNELKVQCNNNLANVHLKEGSHISRVITCSSKVLEIEPRNVKALFRRGKAYSLLNNLDKAEQDLLEASQLDPNDIAIQKELQIMKEKNKIQTQKQQKFYANMFDKMKEEPAL